MEAIVERISKIIDESGMDKKTISEKLDIAAATLSHISSGRNNPSLDLVIKLLTLFPNVSPDWLLFGAGDKERGGIEQRQADNHEYNNRVQLLKMLITEHYRTEMSLLDDLKQDKG
ncbi:MAG: helix-turn-helix domain-containing protein [Bacteroidia bacterium]|nr:helix-turn-helix domain-containing protein [Bacteroidia bacterium]